ncbi:MAG: hypothetical protein R3C61_21060 [Bacteroidia bacterium]
MYYFGGEGVVELRALIFNRWGEKNCRNTFAGSGLERLFAKWESGSGRRFYTYVVKGIFNTGQTFERAGTITLIR